MPQESVSEAASNAFEKHRSRIIRLLPEADIQHVGGTAVPAALTKGDVDLCVRVAGTDFPNAVRALRSVYAIHQPDNWTATYASFKDETPAALPVGVQLTVRGSQDDHFVATRDLLRSDTELLSEYNALKSSHGSDSETYRAAKAAFFENLVTKHLWIRRLR